MKHLPADRHWTNDERRLVRRALLNGGAVRVNAHLDTGMLSALHKLTDLCIMEAASTQDVDSMPGVAAALARRERDRCDRVAWIHSELVPQFEALLPAWDDIEQEKVRVAHDRREAKLDEITAWIARAYPGMPDGIRGEVIAICRSALRSTDENSIRHRAEASVAELVAIPALQRDDAWRRRELELRGAQTPRWMIAAERLAAARPHLQATLQGWVAPAPAAAA